MRIADVLTAVRMAEWSELPAIAGALEEARIRILQRIAEGKPRLELVEVPKLVVPTSETITTLPPKNYLRLTEIARWAGVTRQTINTWRKEGSFPQPIKLGNSRTPYWRREDVMAWDSLRKGPKAGSTSMSYGLTA